MPDRIENDDILSKIRVGLGKGLRIVNIRSKEVYGTVKIKNKIQGNRKKRRKSIFELGESVFKMYKFKDSFDVDSLKNKCVEITKIEQELQDFEEELRQLHLTAQTELGKLKAISKPEEN
ncbi:MAG: hypothetical protein ACR2NW_06285 [Thermodesulfobacteriota bacterium]